jgi:hypothetical protein
VWSPSSANELIAAIDDRKLPHESAAFEVKKQLPDRNKNSDIAADVAAMATDGGVIVYGVLEDKEKVTFTATPISLAGVKDRISDIVTSHVREEVPFDVRLLELDDDPTIGFVVIDVPASIRAPHMVESKGEYRFYGRVPGGNQLLSEAQVARLYQRRERVEEEAGRAPDEWVASGPVEADPGRTDLYIVVKPLLSDSELRERALGGNDLQLVVGAIRSAMVALPFKDLGGRDIRSLLQSTHGYSTIDRYMVINPPFQSSGPRIVDYVAALEVLDDGTCRYFHAAMGSNAPKDGVEHFILDDVDVAKSAAQVSHVAGWLLNSGDYHGAVDVSLLVTNINGVASSHWFTRYGGFFPIPGVPTFPEDEHRVTVRVMANQLQAESCEIAERLTRRLFRVIRQPEFPDPLALT